MNYNSELTNLIKQKDNLQRELSLLQGKYEELGESIEINNTKIKKIDKQRLVYRKSVEFLRVIEQNTKTAIKEGFEKLISYAMTFITQEDYKIKFDFRKRGNSQELYFQIKTPQCSKFQDIEDSQAGGILDIFSLALRIALLSKTKIKGGLILDESFKHLSRNYLHKAGEFLKHINQKLGRQIIAVTHKSELLDYSDNSIELKKGGNKWVE